MDEFERQVVDIVYSDRVYCLAMKFAKRDVQYAKDLVQETAFNAIKNKDKFTLGTNLVGWLCTILRNIFINHTRNNYNKLVRPEEHLEPFCLDMSEREFSRAVYIRDRDEQFAALLERIGRLPINNVRPILLHLDGLKYREIAERLGIPEGTVKARIHLGKQLLKNPKKRENGN